MGQLRCKGAWERRWVRLRWGSLIVVAAMSVLISCGPGPGSSDDRAALIVFAAASLTEAMSALGARFEQREGVPVRISAAASSTLARQIAAGAPAHVYLSANPRWMDYVAERDRIVRGTRVDLLTNGLVLVAPADQPPPELRLEQPDDYRVALGDARFALADPAHVPAGIYGRQALESLGVWSLLAERVTRSDTVRTALALVTRGEAPLGLVYASDAASEPAVTVVARIPQTHHDRIVYPVARVAGPAHPSSNAFLAFLQGPEAVEIFARYGFATLP